MTGIIGYRNPSGEIFLAADSRISWRFNNGTRQDIHIDDLQKIYFPAPNIAIAFTGNNVENIRDVLQDYINHCPVLPIQPSSRDIYRYNQSIKRLLKRYLVNFADVTEILIGISFPGNSECNGLFCCGINERRRVNFREISKGEYIIRGSILNEESFEDFRKIINGAFKLKKSVDILYSNSIFNAVNAEFQNRLEVRWRTVGELFCTTYTSDGQFIGLANDISIHSIDRTLNVKIDYDETNRCYVQESVTDGTRISLIPLNQYNFQVPQQDNEFNVF